MPFTAAHPAAVLPLLRPCKAFRIGSALVVGSLIPDLVHFLPSPLRGVPTHDVPALLWFCLPVGLVAWVAWERLVGPFVHAIAAPARPIEPSGVTAPFRVARVGVVAGAVVVGAASHVLWDSFTHEDGRVVDAVPLLRSVVIDLGDYTLRGYSVLQHGSTVIGLIAVGWWLARREWTGPVARERVSATPAALLAGLVVSVGAVVAAVAAHGAGGIPKSAGELQRVVGAAVRAGGASVLVGVVVAALVWRVARGQSRSIR